MLVTVEMTLGASDKKHRQERTQTVGLGEIQCAQTINSADLGATLNRGVKNRVKWPKLAPIISPPMISRYPSKQSFAQFATIGS